MAEATSLGGACQWAGVSPTGTRASGPPGR